MKINDYSGIGALGQNTSVSNDNKQTENQVSFADQLSQVLQQALIEATDKHVKNKEKPEDHLLDEELKNETPLALRAGGKVALASNSDEQAAINQSVNALDELLGIMEQYEARLADPNTSLKELNPLVNSMQAKAAALEGSLSSIDASLNPLANQIISQAQIEAIKFHRGDYV